MSQLLHPTKCRQQGSPKPWTLCKQEGLTLFSLCWASVSLTLSETSQHNISLASAGSHQCTPHCSRSWGQLRRHPPSQFCALQHEATHLLNQQRTKRQPQSTATIGRSCDESPAHMFAGTRLQSLRQWSYQSYPWLINESGKPVTPSAS